MPPYVPEPGETAEGFGAATLANVAGAPSANRGGIFYKYNTGGKRSITVDARHPKGLALLKDLVSVSDVVTESFAAGTFERWGLGYPVLKEIKPEIIYVLMSGFGHSGPDASHVTMGPTAQALTGLTFMVGLPDRPPAGGPSPTSTTSAAIWGRRHPGRPPPSPPDGRRTAPRRLPAGTGHRPLRGPPPRRVPQPPAAPPPGLPHRKPPSPSPTAPAGAYRAAGTDRWIVISCRTEAHWDALVTLMGRPPWAEDPRFATLEGRVDHADELDALLETWTSTRDRYEAMDLLQRPGSRPGWSRTRPTGFAPIPSWRPGAITPLSPMPRSDRSPSWGSPSDVVHPSLHRRPSRPGPALSRGGHLRRPSGAPRSDLRRRPGPGR